MVDRPRKLVGHDDCRCVLPQYCDGTCQPIYEDADVVDQARVMYAEHPTYRGTTPLPWHYAPLEARKEWVAKAAAIVLAGRQQTAAAAPPEQGAK